jgi:ABC-2 type transport system permease protein
LPTRWSIASIFSFAAPSASFRSWPPFIYGAPSIAARPGPVAGYSLAGMISYYLMVTIVDTLTAVNEDDWQIAADIKDGNISQFLLKPINYLTYRFASFFPEN